jgi:hypothetical protein
MSDAIDATQVRDWIDDELVDDVDSYPDADAEFNFVVDMSNILIHVIRREPDGPLLVGQQIEYGDDIRSHITDLRDADRQALLVRIRETLTGVPVVYGFQDETGTNVRFEEMSHVFLEHRIYPGNISQESLMSGLVAVWKAMRYLDDIIALIDSVARR